jgi:hypothetical protein
MDTTIVNDVQTGINLVTVIISGICGLIGIIAGRVHARRNMRKK